MPCEKGDPALSRILDVVKARETDGYAYDSAQASFELLARRELGLAPGVPVYALIKTVAFDRRLWA